MCHDVICYNFNLSKSYNVKKITHFIPFYPILLALVWVLTLTMTWLSYWQVLTMAKKLIGYGFNFGIGFDNDYGIIFWFLLFFLYLFWYFPDEWNLCFCLICVLQLYCGLDEVITENCMIIQFLLDAIEYQCSQLIAIRTTDKNMVRFHSCIKWVHHVTQLFQLEMKLFRPKNAKKNVQKACLMLMKVFSHVNCI